MAKSPAAADFIAKIVKDPKNPPETLMLTGFLGASSEDGHTRLYFDAGLGSYVEIPNDAILHTEPAGDEGLSASYVWIKRDAVLIYGPASSQRPKGTFLEGPIMQQHLGAAGPAAAAAQPMPGGNPRSDFVACSMFGCPPRSDFRACPHSDFVPCQSWICPPTPHAHCPPTPPMLCMTVHCTVPPQCPHPTLPPICPVLSAPPHCPHPTLPPICPLLSAPPCPLPTRPPMCPLLSAPPNCPTAGPCPSIACQSLACQSAACHPGAGGGMEAMAAMAPGAHAAASAVCATAIACQTLPQICGIVPPSLTHPCLTQQPHCVSAFIPCPSGLPCPTHHIPCGTTQHFPCHSAVFICPTTICQVKQ
jgi:hypothetical protein